MPTRFPGGVNPIRPGYALDGMNYPNPAQEYFFCCQNKDWVDAIAATPVTFTKTVVGTGAATYGDQSNMVGPIVLTTSANAADQVSIQSKARVARADSSKKLVYSTSVLFSSVVNTAGLLGLTRTTTTPIGAAAAEWTGVSDGMFFYKPEGSGALGFAVRSASATILNLTNLSTLAFGVQARLGFEYSNGRVKVWVDDTLVANQAVSTFPSLVFYQQMSVRTVDASARSMQVDYIFSTQER